LFSADEFAFFPFAFLGGTFSTKLMAALLLAHGGKYAAESGFKLGSVSLGRNKGGVLLLQTNGDTNSRERAALAREARILGLTTCSHLAQSVFWVIHTINF